MIAPASLALLAGLALAGCASNPTPRCATDGDCGSRAYCYSGFCLPDTLPSDASSCTLCGPSCFDLSRDHEHCGSCAHHCSGDEQCVLGACVQP